MSCRDRSRHFAISRSHSDHTPLTFPPFRSPPPFTKSDCPHRSPVTGSVDLFRSSTSPSEHDNHPIKEAGRVIGMGEIIEFACNGGTAEGYLAVPSGGAESGPGIVVLQEWWGLVDQIKRTCDRFAEVGFTAFAPDLYHGTTVPLTEPDEAGKEMMALKMDSAARDLSGAVDELVRRTGRAEVGVIGFCMGGGLALVLATQRPDAVKAVVPAYGLIPWPDAQPDYSKLTAAVLGHAAAEDDYFTPESARQLEAQLRDLGKQVEFHIYEGAGHAFFNEDRPEAYHPESAGLLWDRSVAFFREQLG
jgi:carboxymethylenebutenolidase